MLHTAWTTLTGTALFPPAILANTITPLMVMLGFRLLVGNILLGIIEGLILARFFGVSRNRAIWIMILANYASMLGGLVLVHFLGLPIAERWIYDRSSLYYGFYLIMSMPILAYIVTIFLEWPFCHWINQTRPKSIKRSLAGSLLVQTISYIPILFFYYNSPGLYRQTSLDSTMSFAKNTNAWVYFISENDGFIYRCRTNGTSQERVFEQQKLDHQALFIWPDKESKTLELWYANEELIHDLPWDGSLPTWYQLPYRFTITEPFQSLLQHQAAGIEHKYSNSVEDFRKDYGDIADYRPPEQREWIVSISKFFFLGEGLLAKKFRRDTH